VNRNDDCARFGFRADLHRWQQLVSPALLAGLLAQAPVLAAPVTTRLTIWALGKELNRSLSEPYCSTLTSAGTPGG
jgi:hypothetical protein